MSDELMPCPFCGGEAKLHLDPIPFDTWDAHTYVVGCTDSDCAGASGIGLDRQHVIDGWNRRAPVVHLAPDFSVTINAPSGGRGVAPIGCGLTPPPESSDGVP